MLSCWWVGVCRWVVTRDKRPHTHISCVCTNGMTDLDHDVGDVEGGDVGEEVAELDQSALRVLENGVVGVEGGGEEEDCWRCVLGVGCYVLGEYQCVWDVPYNTRHSKSL